MYGFLILVFDLFKTTPFVFAFSYMKKDFRVTNINFWRGLTTFLEIGIDDTYTPISNFYKLGHCKSHCDLWITYSSDRNTISLKTGGIFHTSNLPKPHNSVAFSTGLSTYIFYGKEWEWSFWVFWIHVHTPSYHMHVLWFFPLNPCIIM